MLMLKEQDITALKKFLIWMRDTNDGDYLDCTIWHEAKFLLDRITAAEHGYKSEDNTCP